MLRRINRKLCYIAFLLLVDTALFQPNARVPRAIFVVEASTQTRQNQEEQESSTNNRNERREERQRRREDRRRARQKRQSEFFDANGEESRQELLDSFRDLFKSFFPTQRPRDAAEGLIGAVKSVAVGGLAGIASFLSAPVVLARNGWSGFALGCLSGALVGSLAIVAGILNGVHQLWMGIAATPESVQARFAGMRWDDNKREWHFYSLKEEGEELRHATNETTTLPKRAVKSMEFYDLLGVQADASSKEIKRGYFRKAKDIHPDKNPDDVEAADKFLKLHTAYQTLSDEEKRAAYDSRGASSIGEDMPELDAFVFFEIVFGSQLVEPYIGELNIAAFANSMLKIAQSGSQIFMPSKDHRNVKSRKRQLEVASNLLSRVQDYIDGNESEVQFRKSCRIEAKKILRDSAFGERFLATIGSSLKSEAGQFLGFSEIKRWPKGLVFFANRQKSRSVALASFVSKSSRVVWHLLSIGYKEFQENKENKDKSDRVLRVEKLKELLPGIQETAWLYSVRDISSTLHGACWRLFADAAGSDESTKRAEAIQILGHEFARVASWSAKDEKVESMDDVLARLETAFNLALQKKS